MTLEERGMECGDYVRHFKGDVYQILATAIHTETKENLVLYAKREPSEIGIWARPEEMFCSEVDHEKYPDAKQKYRMEKLKVELVNEND